MTYNSHASDKFINEFNRKIDCFKSHKNYFDLREKADHALRSFQGDSYIGIINEDFINRIVAMPIDYIQDWLDKKNQLKWRPCDKLMLDAIKGDYVELIEKYPDAKIVQLHFPNSEEIYKESGYNIVKHNDNTFAIRPNEV